MNLSRFKALVLSCAATVAFVGCGGGSDSTSTAPVVATGTFVDAPVQGLKYTTATQTGYTDSNGTYKYVAGEQVEFFLGNLSLGKVTASSLTTPYTMAGDTNISAPSDKAKNIAMLLQNFDANRSDSAVLDVSKLKDHDFSDVNLSATTANMETKITALLGTLGTSIDSSHPLINATTASTTMKTYVADAIVQNLKPLFVSKTFFEVSIDPQDHNAYINSDVFNTDATSMTNTNLDANGNIVANTATIIPDPLGGGDFTITSTTDYLLVHNIDGTDLRLYFDKVKALSYFKAMQEQIAKPLVAGKTFFTVGIDPADNQPYINSGVFNADATLLTYTHLDASGNIVPNTSQTVQNPLAGGDFIITSTVDYLLVQMTDKTDRLYFDKVKALSYYNSLPTTGGTILN
jgi:hypothetical protein